MNLLYIDKNKVVDGLKKVRNGTFISTFPVGSVKNIHVYPFKYIARCCMLERTLTAFSNSNEFYMNANMKDNLKLFIFKCGTESNMIDYTLFEKGIYTASTFIPDINVYIPFGCIVSNPKRCLPIIEEYYTNYTLVISNVQKELEVWQEIAKSLKPR